MIKITIDNDSVVLTNDLNRKYKFKIDNKAILNVIKQHAEKYGSNISIEKDTANRSCLIFANDSGKYGSKLLIHDSIAYQISTRMILLNQYLQQPIETPQPTDE